MACNKRLLLLELSGGVRREVSPVLVQHATKRLGPSERITVLQDGNAPGLDPDPALSAVVLEVPEAGCGTHPPCDQRGPSSERAPSTPRDTF